MSLENVLDQKREEFLIKWFQLMVDAYPAETAKFLKREKNPFANPVGRSIHEGISGILDLLVRGVEHGKASEFLDRIIRVRAVQDFSPAQALAFVFDLRGLLRDVLVKEIDEGGITADELALFDAKVDELALISFNVYTACREQLYEIKVEEIKNRSFRLLQKAGLLEEISETREESGEKGGDQ